MYIAFFLSEFPSVSETFIVNQIADLKQRGARVRIYAGRKGTAGILHSKIVENKLLADTIFLDQLPRKRMAKIRLLLRQLFYHFSLKSLALFFGFLSKGRSNGLSVYELVHYLGQTKADIVHAHFGINGSYVAKLKERGLFADSRFITTFHGYDLEVKGADEEYHQLFASGDVFTINSEFARKKLLTLGCRQEKVWKIPVGLDLDFFSPPKSIYRKSDVVTILFVGRLIALKGPDTAIQVLNVLKRKTDINFRLVVVGEGEMMERLTELICQFKLENSVVLTGAKSQTEVKKLMSESDIFFLPGRTINGRAETQGLVIQEAQAMGLPVVISSAGGMSEGIIDGVTGFIVEEEAVNDYAKKIFMLASNGQRRNEIGLRGRVFVERHFSINNLNDKLLALYAAKDRLPKPKSGSKELVNSCSLHLPDAD